MNTIELLFFIISSLGFLALGFTGIVIMLTYLDGDSTPGQTSSNSISRAAGMGAMMPNSGVTCQGR